MGRQLAVAPGPGGGGGGGTMDHGELEGLADDDHPQYQLVSAKDQVDGYASLDGSGKVPTGLLPALAITDSFVVANQAAMLALTAEVGDVAIRTDQSKSYILQTAGASTLANWKELLTPADAVTSVNGNTGVVTISAAGLGALQVSQNLNDLGNKGTARTNLGVAIGSDVQAFHANLAALAGLVGAANKLAYFTGAGALTLADLSAAGRALIDDADAAAQLTTLGFSAFGKTIIDDADASAVLTTLGVSAFAKTFLDDTDAAAVRATLGVTAGNVPFTPVGTIAATDVQAAIAEVASEAGGGSGTIAYGATPPASPTTGSFWLDTTGSYALGGARRSTFNNVDVTAAATDKFLAQVGTLTASRTVTLPSAAAAGAGYELIVADESGTVTPTNAIVIARAGADTINGATSENMTSPYGWRRLVSDGVSKWTFDAAPIGLARYQGTFVRVGGGYWHMSSFMQTPAGSAWPTVNRTYYTPIYFGRPVTVSAIALNITAVATAGNVIRLGLYNSDNNYLPATLLGQGTQANDSTGVKTVTFGAAIVLPPGLYWMAANPQGSTSPGSAHLCTPNGEHFTGGDTGSSWAGAQMQNIMLTESGAFASNPAVTYDSSRSRFPYCALRVS